MMVAIGSFFFGLAGAWLISKYAFQWGLMDMPNHRSSHLRPTPRGGGVGIVAAFISCSIGLGIPMMIWVPMVALSIVSFFDDRLSLPPFIKLCFQFIAAAIVVTHIWPDRQSTIVICLLVVFRALFIVASANFYNFMDGINGIAGVTGIVGFGLLGAYGLVFGKDPSVTNLSLGIAFACAGFLPLNLFRAKVFMGDVGSVLMGFLFAVATLLLSESLLEFIVLSSFLFPFYCDEIVTMVERIKDRQTLTKPHRSHLYQVLANEAGIAHWKVAAGYGVFQLTVGGCMWIMAAHDIFHVVLPLVIFGFIFIAVNITVKRVFVPVG